MLKFIKIHFHSCWQIKSYFKTSYVEVYPRNSRQGVFPTRISKHLMLKFIKMWLLMNGCLPNFKTSYVEVYRNWIWLKVEIKKNFKTSYVEVYRWTHGWCSTGNEISKHLMLKFILKSISGYLHKFHFKTSYVEVYRLSHFVIGRSDDFKTSYVEVYRVNKRRKEFK